MDTLDSIQKMKQWSACIVSTILYVRRFFSEVDYADYQYNNNITLKVLSKLSNSNRVQAIIEHLQDVFDAIDKEYLQMLMIEVIGQAERQDGGSADEVVETYSIEYTKRDIFDPKFVIEKKRCFQKVTYLCCCLVPRNRLPRMLPRWCTI